MKFFRTSKKELIQMAFIQATGVLLYISGVAFFMWGANTWLGKMTGYVGPVLALLLFSTSALVCALMVLGYPFYLIWLKNKKGDGIRIVALTALWLMFYTLMVVIYLFLR